jgi:hypothetical protein
VLLTSQRAFCRVVPAAPDSSDLPRLGFTLCDRDVSVLVAIHGSQLSEVPGGNFLADWSSQNQSSGYIPFYLELPSPSKADSPGESPATFPPEHMRLYSEIRQRARESGYSALSFLRHTPFFSASLAQSGIPAWHGGLRRGRDAANDQ